MRYILLYFTNHAILGTLHFNLKLKIKSNAFIKLARPGLPASNNVLDLSNTEENPL